MLASNLPAFENKKYTACDRFHCNGPYGEIPIKKEAIRKRIFYNNKRYLKKNNNVTPPAS